MKYGYACTAADHSRHVPHPSPSGHAAVRPLRVAAGSLRKAARGHLSRGHLSRAHLSLETAQASRFSLIVFLILAPAGVAYSATATDNCPRPHIGGVVVQPADLYSSNGALNVEFSFKTFTDTYGRRLYCYIAGDGSQAPTLRVKAGDELVLKLRNDVPVDAADANAPGGPGGRSMGHTLHDMEIRGPCGSGTITAATTNLHFHGLSIPPVCHQDEAISTLVQPSGSSFEYRFKIPLNQAPGLYWYHPHPHGFSEAQVLGGASGALIVEGIEGANPRVTGLPERVLVLRDQIIPGMADEAGETEGPEPSKDVSINFVAIMYPLNRPAAVVAKPNQREFWRILNAAADTYFDLQIRTGPSLQSVRDPLPLELVAVDGAPAGGDPIPGRTDVLLPPGARAEFVVTTPAEGVFAQLVTLPYDTGTGGESTPYRVIANLFSSRQAPAPASRIPQSALGQARRFMGLIDMAPVRERKLYFSEKRDNPDDPKSPLSYFITLDGSLPKAFDMNFTQPDVTVQQGTLEDWVIENRAVEAHAFHIHQIHFQVLERDGRTVNEPLLRDTIDLPYWDGKSPRYPSVRLRMDFRDPNIIGTFLYHCHILEHEDGGMMGSIRVEPPRNKK
jgi:FtsP/CotA-like multicopper oxidase with cupredoxin domain